MAIVATTLSAAITASQTSFGVASATGITTPNFQTGSGITYLYVDQEVMLVTGITGTVVSVVRGFNGTQAVAHLSGANVMAGLPGDIVTQQTIENPVTFGAVTVGSTIQPATFLTGSADAISNTAPGFYVVKTAGVDAMTLAAPAAAAEGIIIDIWSDTTNAHTLTATSLLANGTALKTTATFPAFRGAGLRLRACNGVYHVMSNGASAGVVVLT